MRNIKLSSASTPWLELHSTSDQINLSRVIISHLSEAQQKGTRAKYIWERRRKEGKCWKKGTLQSRNTWGEFKQLADMSIRKCKLI